MEDTNKLLIVCPVFYKLKFILFLVEQALAVHFLVASSFAVCLRIY